MSWNVDFDSDGPYIVPYGEDNDEINQDWTNDARTGLKIMVNSDWYWLSDP